MSSPAANTIIAMEDVSSSSVHQIGYDPELRTVRVTFKNAKKGVTATYDYWSVEEADYSGIRNAGSIGSAVHQYLVRGGLYSSAKVCDGPAPQ